MFKVFMKANTFKVLSWLKFNMVHMRTNGALLKFKMAGRLWCKSSLNNIMNKKISGRLETFPPLRHYDGFGTSD